MMMMEGDNRVTSMQEQEQVEDKVVQETDRLAWRIVMEEAQQVLVGFWRRTPGTSPPRGGT